MLPSDPRLPWTPGKWLFRTSCLSIAALAFCSLGNCWIDYYALYGNARGKLRHFTANDERATKYLYSMNYIPANFDGLLLGPSITGNWDTEKFTSANIYNASLDGGDITEAKRLADNVLSRRKLRVVLFTQFAYFTQSGAMKTNGMEPRVRWESLGSIRLLSDYLSWFAARNSADTTAYGVWKYHKNVKNAAAWEAGQTPAFGMSFVIDPVARENYASLIREARRNGALIVRLRPLIYTKYLEEYRAQFTEYFRQMDLLFGSSDPVIDFSAAPYEDLQSDRKNFMDGVHIKWETAARLVREMDTQLRPRLAR